MIKLFISDNDVTNGTIAITWCVSHETLDKLSKREILDPQVVICVAPSADNKYDIRKEFRKVVPLKDLMTYVEFRNPGKNKIWAFISGHDGAKRVKRKYMTREGYFVSDILTCEGDEFTPHIVAHLPYMTALPIEVEVPAECFAPEPAEWEKAWVNHWFYNKPIDQCNYRRRRLLAYTIQPIAFFLMGVVKTLILLMATLIGARNWSLKYLLHPLTYSIRDSMDIFDEGSIFIRHLPEDDEKGAPNNMSRYLLRKLYLVPFMPIILILMALSIYFHLWPVIATIFGGVLFALLIIFTVDTNWVGRGIAWIRDHFLKGVDKAIDPEYWYLRQEEVDMIVCDGSQKTASVAALPPKKRTIMLRFSEIKSKVCRPFSA